MPSSISPSAKKYNFNSPSASVMRKVRGCGRYQVYVDSGGARRCAWRSSCSLALCLHCSTRKARRRAANAHDRVVQLAQDHTAAQWVAVTVRNPFVSDKDVKDTAQGLLDGFRRFVRAGFAKRFVRGHQAEVEIKFADYDKNNVHLHGFLMLRADAALSELEAALGRYYSNVWIRVIEPQGRHSTLSAAVAAYARYVSKLSISCDVERIALPYYQHIKMLIGRARLGTSGGLMRGLYGACKNDGHGLRDGDLMHRYDSRADCYHIALFDSSKGLWRSFWGARRSASPPPLPLTAEQVEGNRVLRALVADDMYRRGVSYEKALASVSEYRQEQYRVQLFQ